MNKTKELLKIIGYLILVLIITFGVNILLGTILPDPSVLVTSILGVLLAQILFAICAYFIIKKKKSRYGSSYIKNIGFRSDSWKMLIIGLGTAGFGNLLINSLVSILGEDNALVNNSIQTVNTAFSATGTFQIIVQILVLVIVAPIVEEYLFRGYVFRELKRLYPLVGAVILNGLLFGLYHMNLLQTVNTFFLGIILSLVYYYRANITDAILVHVANNAIAIFTAFFPQYAAIVGPILIVCIILGLFILYKIAKNSNRVFDNDTIK